MTGARLAIFQNGRSRWLEPLFLGAAIGLGVTAVNHLGLWHVLFRTGTELTETLTRTVGPVWIPMLLAALRVGWLSGRALRTRAGRGRLGEPVRPELGHIAPLFAALGLCGTVWGLSRAFDALNGNDFLTQLPLLLGGLGAAMTSTLVGLSLQIVTLLLGLLNPAWSRIRVGWEGEGVSFTLDRRSLGTADEGFAAVIGALQARQPEAVCLAYDRRVPSAVRSALSESLWRQIDSTIPVREVVH